MPCPNRVPVSQDLSMLWTEYPVRKYPSRETIDTGNWVSTTVEQRGQE